MENFTIKMEACTTETGNKIKWKGMANFITNQESLHMKANGEMTNLWAKESFIMKFLNFLTTILTITTLTMLTNFGPNTKVNFF